MAPKACSACLRKFRDIPPLTKAGAVCSDDGTLQLLAYELLWAGSRFCTPCLEPAVAELQSEVWKDRAAEVPRPSVDRVLDAFRALRPDDVALGASAPMAVAASVVDVAALEREMAQGLRSIIGAALRHCDV